MSTLLMPGRRLLILSLFGDQGLVVIDPRRSQFRAAARPIIDRYLERAAELAAAARDAGAWLEKHAGRREAQERGQHRRGK